MHLVCKIKPNGAEIRPIDDSTGSLILTAVLLLFPLFFLSDFGENCLPNS